MGIGNQSYVIWLDDALDAIVTELVSLVQAEVDRGSQGRLESVQSVVRGDRVRPLPEMPSVWVMSGDAVNDNTSQGLAEMWSFDVILAALVTGEDPEVQYREATRLAARTRSVVLRNRGLDLPYVRDIVSVRMEPSGPRHTDRKGLFWADAVVSVRFRIIEPEE